MGSASFNRDSTANSQSAPSSPSPCSKILASSCTISSGGSGGVFGPSLFIGGMLGGAVGLLGQQYFPDIVHQPAAYIVVGMASFFGAVANTPLAALILVIEMSGSYYLLPPLMVVSALALIFARNFSIYQNQVQNKFHSPAHIKDLTVNVLHDLQVPRSISPPQKHLRGHRQQSAFLLFPQRPEQEAGPLALCRHG